MPQGSRLPPTTRTHPCPDVVFAKRHEYRATQIWIYPDISGCRTLCPTDHSRIPDRHCWLGSPKQQTARRRGSCMLTSLANKSTSANHGQARVPSMPGSRIYPGSREHLGPRIQNVAVWHDATTYPASTPREWCLELCFDGGPGSKAGPHCNQSPWHKIVV